MRPLSRPSRLLPLVIAFVAGCATNRLHREGVKAFEQGAYEEAIANLEEAVRKDPWNLEYRLDVRVFRDQAVQRLLADADRARAGGDGDLATAGYRRVLALDPGNDRALRGLDGVQADRRHAQRIAKAEQLFAAKKIEAADQEVHAVLSEDPGFAPAKVLLGKIDLARAPSATVSRLKTRDNRPVSLQFRDAPIKMVFEVLARQTGLNFVFDKDVKSDAKTTIFVNQVPVEQAVDLMLAQNQLGWQVMSENLVLVYPNTPAKQKDYREEIVRTFFLTNAAPKEAESMLKTVLGTKTLFSHEHSNTLTIRDTPEHVRMAEKLVASLDVPEPEVVMEVEVLEITHSLQEQLGINYPTNVAFAATKPVNSTASAVSGLALSDLAKQNGNTISVSNLGVSVDLKRLVGASNVLSSPRIRARNKEKAKIVVANRLPVVTSGTSATTGGSFSTSNVQYIDAGLTLEVQPSIHNDGNVAINVKLEVSSIVRQISVPVGNGGTTLAYEIGTRNTSTLLELKDGETQVLAGLIQDSDTRSTSEIPILGELPLLGRLFGSKGTNRDKNEVVLSITPHIIRSRPRPSSDTIEFWYGSESQTRSGPFASNANVTSPAASSAGPVTPGGVSFSGGGGSSSSPAAASTGPRAVPSRIESSAPPPPPPPAAASAPSTMAPPPSPPADTAAAPPADAPAAAQGAPSDGKPKVTIEGPDAAKVGDEISVAVRLASAPAALGRVRTQVSFDAAALQLVSADPGDLAGDAPKVDTRAGGVQLEFTGSGGAPVAGDGTLMNLRFRVIASRPSVSIPTQVVLIGADGVAVAATQATPLKIAIAK